MIELASNIKKNPDQRWIVISDTHIGGNPDGSNIPKYNDLCCFLDWIKHLDEKGDPIWVKKDRLFCWEKIPGEDNKRFKELLMQIFDVKWVKKAKIKKLENGATIRVAKHKNFLTLKLNDKKTRVTLEIDDGRTDEFIAKSEKGKLEIFNKDELDYETRIYSPSMILLLGDILDLWDPEKSDRSYNIKRGAQPLSLLHDIKCDKIYVVGNHDQDLYELADVLEKDKDSLILGSYKMEIYRRHYPLNVDKGIMIGDLKYAFLHGHQFDKVQITEPINKALGIRFDPLDVVLDISNISIVKSVFKEKKWTKPTTAYLVLTGSLLLWIYLQKGSYVPMFQTFTLTNILGDILKAVLVSYIVLTPLVKLIAKYQGPLWNYLFKAKARDKTVKEVLDDGYYKESSDKMENVDVVVFGHTHISGSSYLESRKRLFVNTGGWVKETDGRKLNTFAYIDNNGIEVLSWTGKKEDGRYVFEHICSHITGSLKKN